MSGTHYTSIPNRQASAAGIFWLAEGALNGWDAVLQSPGSCEAEPQRIANHSGLTDRIRLQPRGHLVYVGSPI